MIKRCVIKHPESLSYRNTDFIIWCNWERARHLSLSRIIIFHNCPYSDMDASRISGRISSKWRDISSFILCHWGVCDAHGESWWKNRAARVSNTRYTPILLETLECPAVFEDWWRSIERSMSGRRDVWSQANNKRSVIWIFLRTILRFYYAFITLSLSLSDRVKSLNRIRTDGEECSIHHVINLPCRAATTILTAILSCDYGIVT